MPASPGWNAADPSPYPELTVSAPNRVYAQMVARSISCEKSEFSTISQYLYQSWIVRCRYPELADRLLRIAVVEMKHLNILGQLVMLLGGDPKYLSPRTCLPWNGCMVDYSQDLCRMLGGNLSLERAACRNYLNRAEHIRDPYVSAMLRRLALDEKLHIHLFERWLEELC